MDDAYTTQMTQEPDASPSMMGPSPRPNPGTPNVNIPATPSRELQPLGQPPTSRRLDAATWAGQSLVVALVLGGVALVAFAIKRRQIAKVGATAAFRDESARQARPREGDDADDEPATPRGFAYMGASDAMRDEIAALRAEIESTRDEASALRREVAQLRAMIERGVNETPTRHATHRPEATPAPIKPAHTEPKPEARENRDTVEQRVLALAARGESAISIAQRTGVPTGQVELMLNLARASGRA